MINEKMQKTANKTTKLIAELLKIPNSVIIETRLVDEYDVESDVVLSDDNTHLIITICVSDESLAMFFCIAHELRHVYQMMYIDEMFINYKLEKMHDMNEYNLQPEEIDANAFAVFLCESIFNVGCPPLDETTEMVMKRIENRFEELLEEYQMDLSFDYVRRRFQNNQIFKIFRESAKKYQD